MADYPVSASDWYMAGVVFGWEAPQCTAQAPAPLDDETLQTYFKGVEDGGLARLDFEKNKTDSDDTPPSDYPSIGPTPGGSISLDESLEDERQLLEGLFHQHMPHIDVPEYETWYPPIENVPTSVE